MSDPALSKPMASKYRCLNCTKTLDTHFDAVVGTTFRYCPNVNCFRYGLYTHFVAVDPPPVPQAPKTFGSDVHSAEARHSGSV